MTPTSMMNQDGEYKPGLCSVLFVVLGEFFNVFFSKSLEYRKCNLQILRISITDKKNEDNFIAFLSFRGTKVERPLVRSMNTKYLSKSGIVSNQSSLLSEC